jgi:hypothetical protein
MDGAAVRPAADDPVRVDRHVVAVSAIARRGVRGLWKSQDVKVCGTASAPVSRRDRSRVAAECHRYRQGPWAQPLVNTQV